jgi:hypothetical protein
LAHEHDTGIFHPARCTAFPQPAPGTAPAPDPVLVPAGQLRGLLGVRTVIFRQGVRDLAVTAISLAQ